MRSLKFEKYLHKDLIWLNQNFKNWEELLTFCSEKLVDLKYVNNYFCETIIEREKKYPTGLELEGYSIGIPHCDPECVISPFVAVVTLENPISIGKIEDSSSTVDVKLFFMLGLNNSDAHFEVLKELTSLAQNKELIENITEMTNHDNVINSISLSLNS